MNARPNHRRADRAGFTLVEALISTSVVAIAGSALLLGVSASLETSTSAVEQTIASSMAEQLMDEIAGKRYAGLGAGPYQWPIGPSGGDLAGPGRSRYDDIDDFHDYQALPARDLWNIALGTDDGEGGQRHANLQAGGYFDRWRQEVEVYYVNNTNFATRLAAGQTSNHRAVVVRIVHDDPVVGRRVLVELRRVFAYVPNA